MSSNKVELYDVSKKLREVLEWKDARRKVLREQYLKQSLHPTKQQAILDDALQRFYIFRYTQEYHVKTSAKAQIVAGLTVVGLIFTWLKFIYGAKNETEAKMRAGEISYADRRFKFI